MARNSNNDDTMKNAKKYGKNKNIYFDSNDEMYFESELSEEDIILNGKEGHKNFTKVQLKPSEDERRKMREFLKQQKKNNIYNFLNDVNFKKGTFIH